MDFYQQGITSIHDLGQDQGLSRKLLADASRERSSALVLPIVYSELSRPPMRLIRSHLLTMDDILGEVVVALTCDNQEEYEHACQFFANLPVKTTVLWCESPHVREELESLKGRGLDLTKMSGKGLAVWLGMGVASRDHYGVVLHDGDVETYDAHVPVRLLLPLMVPDADFSFVKGYYARITGDKMFGRVVRLYVWPLLDAMEEVFEHRSEFVRYLRSFRYPLSGEMAMTSDLAETIRVPTDWGLEIGILSEVYRNASLKRIAQTDLGVYSHKHKPVGGKSNEGLLRMVSDITTTIYRSATETEGTVFAEAHFTALRVLYRRLAQDSVRKYHMDCLMNGLRYDRHKEEGTIDQFSAIIEKAGATYIGSPGKEQIPDWLRVNHADPGLRARIRPGIQLTVKDRTRLKDAVERDAGNGRAK